MKNKSLLIGDKRMKNKSLLIAIGAVLTASMAYAACTGMLKTNSADTSCITAGLCYYTCHSPTYDVCDSSNVTETGKVCNTGPARLSGINNVSYIGTCSGAGAGNNCNNGVAQGEGTPLSPQPYKSQLANCGG
jgi:hypothetical protein